MKEVLPLINEKLINILERLTEEGRIDHYLLGGYDRAEFEEVIYPLIEILEFLKDADKNAVYIENFDSVKEIIEKIRINYPQYLESFRSEIDLLLNISNKIFSTLVNDGDEGNLIFDPSSAVIEEITYNVGINNYLYNKQSELEKFIFIFNLSDSEKLLNYIDGTNFLNVEILYHLLYNIEDTLNFSKKYCLFNLMEFTNKVKALTSFLELLIVQKGDLIHETVEYQKVPNVTSDINYKIEDEYNQFSETMLILSEYNKEKGVLEKYLKIYQVIENFMYRMPICKLTNSTVSPKMFSIRDFKRLYGQVDKNEMKALKDLFSAALNLEYKPSQNFKDFISAEYNQFHSAVDSNDLKDSLELIGVNYYSTLTPDNINHFLPSLIYQLRNSIVHNKETEFHLSYGNLPNIIHELLTEFVLICLEDIVYNMIINKNSLIWYNNSQIHLYSH